MADAVPDSIMHEPVQLPQQLVHPLGRYRLLTPGRPPSTAVVQAADIPPSFGTLTDLYYRQLGFTTCRGGSGTTRTTADGWQEEAPNCRDFICQCSSRAAASSFTTRPPSDSSPFIKENHMKKRSPSGNPEILPVELAGFEPATLCLQSRCATSCAIAP